jgi:septum site-determining protein MinD
LGKIIAVVSGKGGTGKTSFTANVGLALAALGCHTLCLDCDITLRNLDLALGLSDRALMDFSDVIAGRCTLEDAVVQHPKYPKLHLLTAPLSARPVPIAPEQMKALLDRIRQTYDYCLIDAPAGLGMGFHLASDYADRAVVVTNTDASSLRDAQRTVMELDRLGRGNLHLVVGRVEKKLLRSLHTTIDDAMDAAGLPLLGVVPEDRNVPYALNTGIPLRECSNYAARAYENIARRIMGQRIPLMRI